jgi:hypothetical protein
MPIDELWHELEVVLAFVQKYMSTIETYPGEKAGDRQQRADSYSDLLQRAGKVFREDSDRRKDCEACTTELAQFSRALVLMYHQNVRMRGNAEYEREYTASLAALKHVAATARLHFLLIDLQALVKDQ